MEQKRPLTRSVLEKQIDAVQKDLDDALERKAFDECGTLQARLQRLISKRVDLPTREELQELVNSLEDEVALAAKNRDFNGAAASQSKLDQARKQLQETTVDEDDVNGPGDEVEDASMLSGFESRGQLEEEISALSKQISEAIEKRDFGTASSLQERLDEREQLRQYFPSIKEIQENLETMKQKLEEAVSKKDFSAAEKLHGSIADLEKKLETEQAKSNDFVESEGSSAPDISYVTADGEKRVFDSRGALEVAIADVSAQVSKSVTAKEFKRADSLQSDVDKMSQLRKLLPSVAELQERIRDRKKELNLAVKNKQFAHADELNATIEELETNLESEKKAAPAPAVAKNGNSKDAVSVKTSPVNAVSSQSVISASPSAISAPVRAFGPPMEVGSSSLKTVRKLRPAKPLTASDNESVLSVAQMLARKRTNACVIVDASGRLSGIVTDTDFTRRVVAKNVDPASTSVSDVMTPNPVCVSMGDQALDALTTMIENHFRHLPVTDTEGGRVSGLIDISKCLTDAISKLESQQDDGSTVTPAEEVVKQVRLVAQQAGGSAQAVALQALLGNLMSQAFGGKTVPTLRSLLHRKPSTIVRPSTSK